MPAGYNNHTARHLMTTTLLMAICALMSAGGCTPAEQPDKLAHNQASGVALLTNHYYYSATLPTGQVITFTDLADDGTLNGLALPSDSIITATSAGTAFLIGNHGEMLTARTVAAPTLKARQSQLARAVVNAMTNTLEERQYQCRQEYRQLEWEINEVILYDPLTDSFSGDAFLLDTLRARQQQITRTFGELGHALNALATVRADEVTITPHYRYQMVFYGSDDHRPRPASLIAVAPADVDLALLCLPDGDMPDDATVFVTPLQHGNGLIDLLKGTSVAARETLHNGTALRMLGYGTPTATPEAMRTPLLSVGTLSDTDTGNSHALPTTLPGQPAGAGSPVLNSRGELVGVRGGTMAPHANTTPIVPLATVRRFLTGR